MLGQQRRTNVNFTYVTVSQLDAILSYRDEKFCLKNSENFCSRLVVYSLWLKQI